MAISFLDALPNTLIILCFASNFGYVLQNDQLTAVTFTVLGVVPLSGKPGQSKLGLDSHVKQHTFVCEYFH